MACQLPDFGGPPIPHAITFGGGLRGIGFDDEMGSDEEDVFSVDIFSVEVFSVDVFFLFLISSSQA
jgi:hypothetical protein